MATSSEAKNSSGGSGCLKVFGIGCGTIALLLFLLPTLAFGGGGIPAFIAVAVVVTLLIVFSRRNAKKNPQAVSPSSEKAFAADQSNDFANDDVAPDVRTSKYLAEPPRPTYSADHGTENPDSVVAPACQHSFTISELAGKKVIDCVCGRSYETAQLLEYKRLQVLASETSTALEALRYKLSMVEAPEQTAAAKVSSSARVAAPVKVKAPKAKVNLSLQQWLIIGASVLVLVAGSVFVSTNIKTMPQWQFELITIGVALATGFGAFKARSISVLLSNFLAAFSSSMQLATLSIIGDQLSPDFIWSNAPAWWWAVELTLLSGIATVLAKFSRNFGWKGIALLASTAAALVTDLGLLQDKISHGAFPLHLAFLSVTAVLVLAQNRFLRAVPQPEVADPAFAEYAKDLGQREDFSLRTFGRFSAALQVVVGAGLAVIGIFWSGTAPVEVVPLLVLSAVWLPVWLTSSFWSDQLSSDAQTNKLVTQISSGVIFVTLAEAAASVASSLALPSGNAMLASGNAILGAVVAIALLAALIFAAPFAKQLAPSANLVTAGLWAGAGSWLFWFYLPRGTFANHAAAGTFLVLFGLLLSVADLRLKIDRNRWIALLTNGLGLVLFVTDVKNHNSPSYGSLGYALVAVVLTVAANLQLPVRWFVAKKLGVEVNPLARWLTIAISALTLFYVQIPLAYTNDENPHNSQLTLAFTLMVYAIVAQALALWSPLKKHFAAHLMANGYLGQWVTVFGILLTIGSTRPDTISTNALLIGCLAIINYAFGTINRSSVKMQLGFAAAIAAFLDYQWSIEDALRGSGQHLATGSYGFALKFGVQLAVVAVATWLHTWFLRKRANVSDTTLVATPIVATGASLLAGAAALGYSLSNDGFTGLLNALLILSVASIAGAVLSRFGALSKVATRSEALGWVGVEYAAIGFLSNLAIAPDQTFDGSHLRWILSTVVLGAAIQLKNVQLRNPILVVAFYLANLLTAWGAAQVTARALDWGAAPEPYTVWFAAALVVSTLLAGKNLGWLRRALLVDVPLLGTAFISAIYAFDNTANQDVSTWRGTIAFAAIAVHAYLRSRTSAPAIWLAVGYLAGAGSSVWLASGLTRWFVPNFEGPEVYSILLTASVLLGHRVLVRRFEATFDDLRYILTTGVLVLPSLAYSLGINSSMIENQWRQVLSTSVITALAYWRINRSRALPWIVVAYASSAGTAVALGSMISKNLLKDYEGPEIYSLLATLAVLLTHRFALPKLKLKSTLFSWGLPIGVALIPSTLFTYTALNLPFQELSAGQIIRVIVVLVVSAALLIHGTRFGNLANASMGVVGLALLVIPNTAGHSDNLVPGSQVESTALTIGALLFVTLWLLARASKLHGSSMLFIGLPVVIVLAPALVRSLMALGNPSLTTVDWWRFGIVLAASLTLLIVGTLREVAGMFYPGLVSVLLSALPYGFRQTGDTQWFLWVLLLLVAGIMVWLAVHLEKIKKAGRTSAVWLKELK